jgi:hypothetical protein
MAKGDWVKVKTEIGGQLVEDKVEVTQNGGKIDVEWDSGRQKLLVVRLLNRVGEPTVMHSYATSAVRSVTEKRADL